MGRFGRRWSGRCGDTLTQARSGKPQRIATSGEPGNDFPLGESARSGKGRRFSHPRWRRASVLGGARPGNWSGSGEVNACCGSPGRDAGSRASSPASASSARADSRRGNARRAPPWALASAASSPQAWGLDPSWAGRDRSSAAAAARPAPPAAPMRPTSCSRAPPPQTPVARTRSAVLPWWRSSRSSRRTLDALFRAGGGHRLGRPPLPVGAGSARAAPRSAPGGGAGLRRAMVRPARMLQSATGKRVLNIDVLSPRVTTARIAVTRDDRTLAQRTVKGVSGYRRLRVEIPSAPKAGPARLQIELLDPAGGSKVVNRAIDDSASAAVCAASLSDLRRARTRAGPRPRCAWRTRDRAGAAAQQEAVVDRPDQQFVRRLGIGVRGAGRRVRCRARRAARPRASRTETTRSRNAWASSGSVARSETRPCMTRPMSVEPSTFTARVHECQQLGPRVTEIGQLDDLLDHVEHDRQGELVLVAPAAVDRGLRDAGVRRDLLDREALNTALDEQLARDLQDRLPRSRSCAGARRGACAASVSVPAWGVFGFACHAHRYKRYVAFVSNRCMARRPGLLQVVLDGLLAAQLVVLVIAADSAASGSGAADPNSGRARP